MDIYKVHQSRTQEILDAKFADGKIKNMYIHEVLEGLAEIRTFPDRVFALKANSDRSLNTILLYTYGEKRPFLTKEDIDSIKFRELSGDDDISMAPMNMYDVARRFYIFYREDMPKNKMRLSAIEILECLHPDEIGIFKGMFTGKLPYKNITLKLAYEAFPDMFPEETARRDAEQEAEKEKVVAKAKKSKPSSKDIPVPPAPPEKRITSEDVELPSLKSKPKDSKAEDK